MFILNYQCRRTRSSILRIAASFADAAVVSPNGIKALLANGLSTFSIKGNAFLVMVLNEHLKILLTVSFYATDFFTILY